jgi:hypothetical protein
MSNASHRLWYFEAIFSPQERTVVGSEGEVVTGEDILKSAFVGTLAEAHAEADRRCVAFETRQGREVPAMSFSPASTLKQP